MHQKCKRIRALAVGGLFLPLVAGCPDSSGLAGLLDLLPSDLLAQVESVISTLNQSLQQDAVTLNETDADEELLFGGSEADFADVPFDAIELSEEGIFDEAGSMDAAMPPLHGGLAGRFQKNRDNGESNRESMNAGRDSGSFRGRWFSADGEVVGFVRGGYDADPVDQLPDGLAGGGSFHGKIINVDGRFIGFISGRYGHADGLPGVFFGHWLDRDERRVGVLRGDWDENAEGDGGEFAGRWAVLNVCDEAHSLPAGDFADDDFGGFQPVDVDPVELETAFDVEDEDASFDDDQGHDAQLGDEDDDKHAEDGRAHLRDDSDEADDVNEAESDDHEHDPAIDEMPRCIDDSVPWGYLVGFHRAVKSDARLERRDHADGAEGEFFGRWKSANRRMTGFVRGRYEAAQQHDAQDGPQIFGRFYGKHADRNGHFRGYIRGVYGRGEHGMLVFRGEYLDADGEPRGDLFGRWSGHRHRGGGPFAGVWNADIEPAMLDGENQDADPTSDEPVNTDDEV